MIEKKEIEFSHWFDFAHYYLNEHDYYMKRPLYQKDCSKLLLSHAWNDFYNKSDHFLIKDEEYSFKAGQIVLESDDAYIRNCIFHDISASHNGAAINDQKTKNLLIEKCTFIKCSVSPGELLGGAINVESGNCVLNFVCGYNCSSSGNEGFCNIEKDESRSINSIYDASVAFCISDNYHTICLWFGSIDVRALNVSLNRVKLHSAITCRSNSAKQGYASKIGHSSFVNNTGNNRSMHLFLGYRKPR